jgi:hypothetical protein
VLSDFQIGGRASCKTLFSGSGDNSGHCGSHYLLANEMKIFWMWMGIAILTIVNATFLGIIGVKHHDGTVLIPLLCLLGMSILLSKVLGKEMD